MRARLKDPTTGTLKEIRKVLAAATEEEASAWLLQAKEDVRNQRPGPGQQTPLFATYAITVLESKTARGELSLENQDRWRHALKHLIGGTYAEGDKKRQGKPVVQGFGETPVSEIRVRHVEAWKTEVCKLINAGRYKPWTCNGWLAIFKTILKSARREFELEHCAYADVKLFDASKHETHTEEDPNALNREQVPKFLSLVQRLYPQHYAMAVFGFATGLRGTNISPIRIKGPKVDLNWETGLCYVRRGAGRLGAIYETTKQKRRYRITLPPVLLEVLRWHVATQIKEGPARDSDFLFPTENGKPRLATTMNKPFAEVSEQMGLAFPLSVHGMRRTYNDMCLAAGVNNLVTRSISGHLTEKMQAEYTSVWAPLQTRAIDSVMALMAGKPLDPQGSLPALKLVR